MRTFLAVPVPEEVREQVSQLISKLQGGNFKIVKPENYHLTLKFLGEKSDEEINQIKSILKPTTQKFNATLSGLGAFPSKDYIKVLWIGLGEGKEEYIQLNQEVDSILSQLNIRKEQDYTPHLTIARVKNVTDKETLQNFLKAPIQSEPFEINSIDMMKSELTPQSPVYTLLFQKQLSSYL